MFVERPDERFRSRMQTRYEQMTVRALTDIFGWKQYDAERAVGQLMDDLPAPVRERGGHEDPTSLAARIAGKAPTDLARAPYADRVAEYDAKVRPDFEKEAVEDYNKHVKPKFDKMKYGG
jgi:hypothetical protein